MNQHLGILGGGQLGSMLALAARPLGLDVTVLDPNAESPARVAATHILAPYDDEDALRRLGECDWITFEFENIPDAAARQLEQTGHVSPPAEALRVAQDRWTEKNTFQDLGIRTAEFRKVDSLADAKASFAELGALVLKTRRFGYDGKGQAVVRELSQLEEAYKSLQGAPAIAERLIPFDRELSILICRGRDDSFEIYPLTQNIHQDGVLRTSIAPAPNISKKVQASAEKVAQTLVQHLSYVGVLALELFQVGDELLVNEFAPRVHNSGHWTIEGAVTSQFENHVRAVCGLPLGSAALRCPSVMTNLLGSIPHRSKILSFEDAHLHDYGKSPRAGRKVGHVTCLGNTMSEALKRAQKVEELLTPVK